MTIDFVYGAQEGRPFDRLSVSGRGEVTLP
jgi:hypothetical protein